MRAQARRNKKSAKWKDRKEGRMTERIKQDRKEGRQQSRQEETKDGWMVDKRKGHGEVKKEGKERIIEGRLQRIRDRRQVKRYNSIRAKSWKIIKK